MQLSVPLDCRHAQFPGRRKMIYLGVVLLEPLEDPPLASEPLPLVLELPLFPEPLPLWSLLLAFLWCLCFFPVDWPDWSDPLPLLLPPAVPVLPPAVPLLPLAVPL
jgi:hypothetical protein